MRIFEGDVSASYQQAHVQAATDGLLPDVDAMFRGQVNGLCGAAVAEWLMLTTGTNDGLVPFSVDVFDREPLLASEQWQDVVEVSFHTSAPEVTLLGWAAATAQILHLGRAGWFRVRYCAMDFDLGQSSDGRLPGDEVTDRYLLQFWPAPGPEHDVVLRISGPSTEYWHQYATSLPPAEHTHTP